MLLQGEVLSKVKAQDEHSIFEHKEVCGLPSPDPVSSAAGSPSPSPRRSLHYTIRAGFLSACFIFTTGSCFSEE